jgi:hypothetical protein
MSRASIIESNGADVVQIHPQHSEGKPRPGVRSTSPRTEYTTFIVSRGKDGPSAIKHGQTDLEEK